MKYKKYLFIVLIFAFFINGCSPSKDTSSKTYRDHTPHIYKTVASGQNVIGNDRVTIDISNTNQGYIMIKYTGSNPKVKARIKTPQSQDLYTYDLHKEYEAFALTGGNGNYEIQIFENVSGTKYSTLYHSEFTVELENEFLPFLYPSQYVNYDHASKTIQQGETLAKNTSNDLEVVENVYNYMVKNMTYDDQKAQLVQNGQLNGYIPDVDDVFNKKTGICFDYAAVMATMLRTQNIPTRMQIGYAMNVDENTPSLYHAWIGVYIKDIGWIDNLIEFDGKSWKMMDPTFASQSNNKKTREYITNQNNYQTKYYY